ncbi:hypothetical protein PTI98_007297 [Pleurotus ostreatus]|nr:hypothetical protein PTI98_007297 [Pleurotus ostreatus]
MTDSPTPKTILLPEILKKIFGLLGDGCNALNARVCKDWSDEALNAIWHDVDAKNLFSLLAPLGTDPPIGFTRELEEEDWDRFERYSFKVHILRFSGQYHISLFKDLGHGRRRLNLLPNLQTLHGPPPTPLLAYPSVQNLLLEGCNEPQVIAWLSIISRRMCHLEGFGIEGGIPPSDQLLSTLVSTLRKMLALKELKMPMSYINDNTFHAFASLPNLRSLHASDLYQIFTASGSEHLSPRSLTSGAFPSHPFPSLVALGVELNFSTASIVIPRLNVSRTLRALRIRSWCNESSNACSSLFKVIQKACPGLEHLEIARTDIGGTIRFSTLDGIQCFQNLTSLILCNFIPGPNHTFALRPLLDALAGLESLTLCDAFPSPNFVHHPSSLATIASVLKNLKTLSIKINAGSAMPVSKFPVPFLKLQKLHLGASSISRPTEVAMYLSRLLPPGCKLEVPVFLERTKWSIVQTWVPLLVQARVEARLKARMETERALGPAFATE